MPLLQSDAPELEVDTWINSKQVDLEDGAYLLYFWNYGCSCCRDRIEVFRRIHQSYPELEVVGIHTPQFDFEQDERNLEKVVEQLDLAHPVAHDSDGRISEAYNLAYFNQAIIVEEGTIVFQQNHRSDSKELLQELSKVLETEKEAEMPEIDEVPPQKFFGYMRTSGLNEEGNYPGVKEYRLPKNRKKEKAYLKGEWKQTEQYIEAGEGAELRFNTEFSEINLLMDPNDSLRDIEVRVNGEPVDEEEAGEDLRVEDDRSYLRTSHPGLYNIVSSGQQEAEITLISGKKARFYCLSYR